MHELQIMDVADRSIDHILTYSFNLIKLIKDKR